MTGSERSLVEGIDREWLFAAAEEDPVRHAYAVWDLKQAPDRVRFVTARVGKRVLAYLLIWYGHPAGPVVHWVGAGCSASFLTGGLPARPVLAVVPEEVTDEVSTALQPVERVPLLVLTHGPSIVSRRAREDGVRALTSHDARAVAALVKDRPDLVLDAYRSLPIGHEPSWGYFEGPRLLGVIRVAVHLPRVWVLGGVFAVLEARGIGIGTALAATATRAAIAAHATPVLALREDNRPARHAYERIGYHVFERRCWIDGGTGLLP